jgi:hypothetical protein
LLKKKRNPPFSLSENRATRSQRRHSIGLLYTTGGIHRKKKHDRNTDSRLRLLEDNSTRDGSAVWMVYTFKFEDSKPHEDPVDIDVWIFVFRAEYLEDF